MINTYKHLYINPSRADLSSPRLCRILSVPWCIFQVSSFIAWGSREDCWGWYLSKAKMFSQVSIIWIHMKAWKWLKWLKWLKWFIIWIISYMSSIFKVLTFWKYFSLKQLEIHSKLTALLKGEKKKCWKLHSFCGSKWGTQQKVPCKNIGQQHT